MEWTIEILTASAVEMAQADLVALLRDAVDGGASVGFLPPLDEDEAATYWASVAAAVAAGERVVLAARTGQGRVIGSVQVDPAPRANGRHRAEVAKLLVLRAARRRGIARSLMAAVEVEALRLGRTTLVLDTRQGDPSEQLYATLGYTLVGAIPRYARSTDGGLDATAIYYRLLDE